MLPGDFKPVLTALAMPPAGPLLLILLGLLVAGRRRGLGLGVAFAGVLVAWFLSCNAVGVLLAHRLLPQVPPVPLDAVRQVQAIVVLGGGVRTHAPEFDGQPQLNDYSLQRLRYGAWLAKRAGKPIAFAGGLGWGAHGAQTESEAAVARRTLQQDHGLTLRWADEQSRDTRENALQMGRQLLPAGVRRIALVTDATHMPRAVGHFRALGFEVLPAPTVYPAADAWPLLEWLPSAEGLDLSRRVLREWLGQKLLGARAP